MSPEREVTQEVHYEIFRRQGPKGAWTLHEIATNRDVALEIAEALMKGQHAAGVKVVKETYHSDTGDYLSLKIFEDGHTQLKTTPQSEDLPHALPCFQPGDLYSYHARSTIARLLCDYLARNTLTVTELIHRADALEKFEATGTLFQHAIQKVAVAQASATSVSVQHIVKSLNELATKAIHQVYRDERRGVFARVEAGQFAKLAAKLANTDSATYLLNGAIAKHLRSATGWDEKVLRLLAILEEARHAGAGAALLTDCVDNIVAEVLHGSAALHQLIGEHENLGTAIVDLVLMFLGEQRPDSADHAGLTALTGRFANDQLPASRTAIANRILAELKSVRRLCPGSLMDEFAMLKRIANKLVLGQGKYLAHEDILTAFALRSRRLVNHERVREYLDGAGSPDDKLERLLFIEENIVGAENKRQIAGFVLPIVTAAPFENHFLFGKTPLPARLHRIADLQRKILKSGFQEHERSEIAGVLDRIASEMESRAKLLDGIETRNGSGVEKAQALLKLFGAGMLTEGRMASRARALLLAHLGQPGFLTGYTAQIAQDANPDAQAALADLMQRLALAGISAEAGLNILAA